MRIVSFCWGTCHHYVRVDDFRPAVSAPGSSIKSAHQIHVAMCFRVALQKKEQIAEGLNSNDKRQRQIATRVQNRNRSHRARSTINSPGGATRNSLPVLVASRRAHVSRSSAAASEQ
ncbi:hypothetical protein ALC53_10931 [Atta colombica]|uniref:Uncharacterized protein n=1 Tax=Atta colombica TaxID=520822 RepID=A0A151HZU9_9HYME|nr:hypothetical protein ALC53_10931 [Atta colombica]